jgi:hypothetical protein
MFFCPNCDNLFDITKNIQPVQAGGGADDASDSATGSGSSNNSTTSASATSASNYNNIIKKILANADLTDADTSSLNYDAVIKGSDFTKLNNKQKDTVFNRLQEYNPEAKQGATKSAFFLCNSCGFSEPIKTGTAIVRRMSENTSDISADASIYKDMIHAKELPYTRRYICPNKSCKTHSHPEKKEAQFLRTEHYKIKYICNECKTAWSIN